MTSKNVLKIEEFKGSKRAENIWSLNIMNLLLILNNVTYSQIIYFFIHIVADNSPARKKLE